MAAQFTIELKKLKFFAAHGLYEEERVAGTEFLVDLSVQIDAPDSVVTSIEDTTDYVRLYGIVKRSMARPTPLLETLCMQIAEEVHSDFPATRAVFLTITKLSPPINNFIGTVAVSYTKSFT